MAERAITAIPKKTRPDSESTTRPSSKPTVASRPTTHPGHSEYVEIIRTQERRLAKLLELVKTADFRALISSKEQTSDPPLSHVYLLQKLVNELTDSLEDAGQVERKLAETVHALHLVRKVKVQLETRLETQDRENNALKSEIGQLQELLHSQTKHAAVELTMRRAEKLKSEKLAREVDTLHRCTAFLLPQLGGSSVPLHKTVVELTRQNQQLYRKCVFATKQHILAELKLKAADLEGHAKEREKSNRLHKGMESLPEYQPLMLHAGPSQVERDFLSFLQASRGLLATVFLSELSANQQQQCVEFLCREFAAFTEWDLKMRTLMEDIEKVNSIKDIDSAIANITDTIRKMTLCDRASIWIVDEVAKEAWTRRAVASTDPVGSESQELRIGLGKGLVGVAYTTKKSVNIADAYEDARFDRSVDMKTGYRTKSVICFPIIKFGRVTAIIQAINKASEEAFTLQDEFVIRVFGTAAAETLGNCENTAVAEWFDYRRDLLVECACLLADRCRGTGELLRILKKTMKRLFRADDVNLLLVMEDHVLRVILDENQDKSGVRTVECNPSIGYVGEVVDHRYLLSVVTDTADKDKDKTKKHNTTVDLDFPTFSDTNSRTALHTFPVMDGTKLRAVLQFTAPATRALLTQSSVMVRPVLGSGGLPQTGADDLPTSDNGCFNEQNSRQVEVLTQFTALLLPYIRRFFPNVGLRKKIDGAKTRLHALSKLANAPTSS